MYIYIYIYAINVDTLYDIHILGYVRRGRHLHFANVIIRTDIWSQSANQAWKERAVKNSSDQPRPTRSRRNNSNVLISRTPHPRYCSRNYASKIHLLPALTNFRQTRFPGFRKYLHGSAAVIPASRRPLCLPPSPVRPSGKSTTVKNFPRLWFFPKFSLVNVTRDWARLSSLCRSMTKRGQVEIFELNAKKLWCSWSWTRFDEEGSKKSRLKVFERDEKSINRPLLSPLVQCSSGCTASWRAHSPLSNFWSHSEYLPFIFRPRVFHLSSSGAASFPVHLSTRLK